MFNDLTLTEVNLTTKEVVREVQIWTLVEDDLILKTDVLDGSVASKRCSL